MREAASRGFWVASRTPFGYNRIMVQDGAKKRPKLEPDDETAYVVKRIFELADTGRGMLDIARVLNDEGISSAAGKLWSNNAVHFILTNEVYTGTLVWGTAATDGADPVRVERALPSIVSKVSRAERFRTSGAEQNRTTERHVVKHQGPGGVRARFRQLPEVGWTSCCA